MKALSQVSLEMSPEHNEWQQSTDKEDCSISQSKIYSRMLQMLTGGWTPGRK